jgi:hypothetical protein
MAIFRCRYGNKEGCRRIDVAIFSGGDTKTSDRARRSAAPAVEAFGLPV